MARVELVGLRDAGLTGVEREGQKKNHIEREQLGEVLDQYFEADRPNAIGMADVTYIPTTEGWGYLAAVMDLCTRKIVGWSIKDTLATELTLEAFDRAVAVEDPGENLIHHCPPIPESLPLDIPIAPIAGAQYWHNPVEGEIMPTHRSATFSLIAAATAVIVLASPVAAKDFFPLDPGLVWTYQGDISDLQREVTGSVEIDGVLTTEIEMTYSGSSTVVRNYWTQSDEGDVYLHAAFNSSGFSVVYDPPVLYLDLPLYVGREWSTKTEVDGVVQEIWFRVFEEGDVTVPYGTFHAFGVQNLPVGSDFDLTGQPLAVATGQRQPPTWFTEGIGDIRNDVYELTGFDQSVSVEHVTWTGVKALFER